MKNKTIKFLICILVAGTFLACKKAKDTVDELQTTVEISGDQAIAENLTADTYDMLQEAAISSNVMGAREESVNQTNQILSCATVTATGNFPAKNIVIDFGAGCTSQNGIFRKGKINIVLTDSIRRTGSVATVTFDNYYVNTYKKEGTITWTNTSQIQSATRSWNRKVANGKIIKSDGTYWTFTSDVNITQTAGALTPQNLTDDVHTLNGTQTTTNMTGASRTLTTQTDLQKKASCANLDKGILKVQGPNHFALIDFGDGTCDNQATISIDGRPSTTITLR